MRHCEVSVLTLVLGCALWTWSVDAVCEEAHAPLAHWHQAMASALSAEGECWRRLGLAWGDCPAQVQQAFASRSREVQALGDEKVERSWTRAKWIFDSLSNPDGYLSETLLASEGGFTEYDLERRDRLYAALFSYYRLMKIRAVGSVEPETFHGWRLPADAFTPDARKQYDRFIKEVLLHARRLLVEAILTWEERDSTERWMLRSYAHLYQRVARRKDIDTFSLPDQLAISVDRYRQEHAEMLRAQTSEYQYLQDIMHAVLLSSDGAVRPGSAMELRLLHACGMTSAHRDKGTTAIKKGLSATDLVIDFIFRFPVLCPHQAEVEWSWSVQEGKAVLSIELLVPNVTELDSAFAFTGKAKRKGWEELRGLALLEHFWPGLSNQVQTAVTDTGLKINWLPKGRLYTSVALNHNRQYDAFLARFGAIDAIKRRFALGRYGDNWSQQVKVPGFRCLDQEPERFIYVNDETRLRLAPVLIETAYASGRAMLIKAEQATLPRVQDALNGWLQKYHGRIVFSSGEAVFDPGALSCDLAIRGYVLSPTWYLP